MLFAGLLVAEPESGQPGRGRFPALHRLCGMFRVRFVCHLGAERFCSFRECEFPTLRGFPEDDFYREIAHPKSREVPTRNFEISRKTAFGGWTCPDSELVSSAQLTVEQSVKPQGSGISAMLPVGRRRL